MNALDVMKYGNRTVLQTLAGVPESEWETPGVCGVWSTREIIAHLASHEQVLAEVLTGFLGGGPTPTLDQYRETRSEFNDAQVALRKDMSMQQVRSEYEDIHARTMSLLAQIPGETLRQPGTIPWYGMEYALDDWIAYGFYGHKREHSAQIAVFIDQLSRGTWLPFRVSARV